MAKTGRLTPDKWGPFAPAQNSIAQRGPWLYRDTETVMVEFLTDEDSALDLMPPELELVEPATAFMVIETNHWTTIGPYGEVYNGILCNWQGELHAYVPGVYVTGEGSQIVGREVWGFGKKRVLSLYARPSFQFFRRSHGHTCEPTHFLHCCSQKHARLN